MILLAEDNDTDVELILAALQQQVSEDCIQHARDGNQALELLRQWDDRPLQLALINVNLSGLEILKQLRAKRETSHVPVVMLGSTEDSDEIAHYYDLGANSFISKSNPDVGFGEAIEQIAPYWLDLNQPCIQMEPES